MIKDSKKIQTHVHFSRSIIPKRLETTRIASNSKAVLGEISTKPQAKTPYHPTEAQLWHPCDLGVFKTK